jgi:cell division protein FtsB
VEVRAVAAPLTEEDRAELKRQLASLKDADEMIARAKRAGLDMSAEEEAAATLRKQLTGIQGAFFPSGR